MGIHNVTQVNYPLTFSERDANARDAIEHHDRILRFRALLNQGKPIPKELGEYILSLIPTKRPAYRPINLLAYFHKITMGMEVERRVLTGMKYEAAVSEVRDWMLVEFGTMRGSKASTKAVKAAHTLFRRLASIAPRPRGKRKQQLSK